MLVPGVDDAPHTLECLGTVLAFSPVVQPVERGIDRVNGFVGWILLVSLNRCEEIVCTVCLSVGTDLKIQSRSEGVDGRRRKTVS